MRMTIITLLLLMGSSAPVVAQQRLVVAIMDFKATDIDPQYANKVTELIRIELVRSDLFTVVERNNLDNILREQGAACNDVACAVRLGQVLAAKKIILGNVMAIDTQIAVTVRVVDVDRGVSEYADKTVAASPAELVKTIERFSKKLAKEIVMRYQTANRNRQITDTAPVFEPRRYSAYRSAADPTLWIGVAGSIGSLMTIIGSELVFEMSKKGPDRFFNANMYLLSGSIFNDTTMMLVGVQSYYDEKQRDAQNIEKRNKLFIGAGCVGGFAVVMFITHGIRKALATRVSVGEVYRNGTMTVFIPAQYQMIPSYQKNKFPGLGLGVSVQF